MSVMRGCRMGVLYARPRESGLTCTGGSAPSSRLLCCSIDSSCAGLLSPGAGPAIACRELTAALCLSLSSLSSSVWNGCNQTNGAQ